MSMDRLRARAEAMIPAALLAGLGFATLSAAYSVFGSRSPDQAAVTTDGPPLPKGKFNPYDLSYNQLGEVNCADAEHQSIDVAVPASRAPFAGIMRAMRDGKLVDAVRFRVSEGGDGVGVETWRLIPGMEASVNRSFRNVPGGIDFEASGGVVANVKADGDSVVLSVSCARSAP